MTHQSSLEVLVSIFIYVGEREPLLGHPLPNRASIRTPRNARERQALLLTDQ